MRLPIALVLFLLACGPVYDLENEAFSDLRVVGDSLQPLAVPMALAFRRAVGQLGGRVESGGRHVVTVDESSCAFAPDGSSAYTPRFNGGTFYFCPWWGVFTDGSRHFDADTASALVEHEVGHLLGVVGHLPCTKRVEMMAVGGACAHLKHGYTANDVTAICYNGLTSCGLTRPER